jgi:hypothetical protein
MKAANTLAYYDTAKFCCAKKFYSTVPRGLTLKLFTAVIILLQYEAGVFIGLCQSLPPSQMLDLGVSD